MKPEHTAIIITAIAIAVIIIIALPKDRGGEKVVQPAAVAGQWYPGDKAILRGIVEKYINDSQKKGLNGTVRAVIVPHAGYEYSGKVAAAAFKQLGSYDKIFLLGPSHYYPLEGIAILNATHYATPLGEAKISAVEEALLLEGAAYRQEAFSKEHSLEAEIPFLQVAAPESELVPVLVGEMETENLAAVLEKYLGDSDLLVVSADLSHFHNDSIARQLDAYTIEKVLNLDDSGIFSAEIDAPWAVAALLKIAKEREWKPVLLNYANSGDVTGDRTSVVGYAAVAFVSDQLVSKTNQKFLLELSRQVLENFTISGKTTEIDESSVPLSLQETRGCFVTLKKQGELRGCIGHIEPQEQLYKCVIDNTINAASRDSRFSPVTEDELKEIKIEISVLTKPERLLAAGEELKSNLTEKDGVVLKQFLREATYLPQVWTQIQDKQQFLSSLCTKGGMQKDCWLSEQTEVYTYQDFVFGDE